MTTKDKALKLALEALEDVIGGQNYDCDTDRCDEAITAIREALAEQPAQQQEPVNDSPINEGWQITVANGHSGYGVYAHMEDYPEEGAVLVQAIEQPAQQQEPVARVINKSIVWRPCDIAGLPTGSPLYTSPPAGARTEDGCSAASKPWVGLTQQDIDIAFDDTQEGGGFDEFARAIEAKLREKNQ